MKKKNQSKSDKKIISLSSRKEARTLGIVIGVTIFASGVIQKLIEKLF